MADKKERLEILETTIGEISSFAMSSNYRKVIELLYEIIEEEGLRQ